MCLLVLLSHPILRRPSYEIFLRTHQVLAVLSAYSKWRHLPSDSLFPRMYIYISAGLFLSTSAVHCIRVLRRNGTFRHGHARALVTHADDCQGQHHPFPAVEGRSRTINQFVDSFRKLLVLPAEPSIRGGLVVARGSRSTRAVCRTSPGTDSGPPLPRSDGREGCDLPLPLGDVQWSSRGQCSSGRASALFQHR